MSHPWHTKEQAFVKSSGCNLNLPQLTTAQAMDEPHRIWQIRNFCAFDSVLWQMSRRKYSSKISPSPNISMAPKGMVTYEELNIFHSLHSACSWLLPWLLQALSILWQPHLSWQGHGGIGFAKLARAVMRNLPQCHAISSLSWDGIAFLGWCYHRHAGWHQAPWKRVKLLALSQSPCC